VSAAERLGRGWRFPLLPRGRALEYAQGAEQVRQAILLILETEPGERVMRPGFGCGLRRYLMHPNTPATRALMERDVELALARWEPRVAVTSVAALEGDDPALVTLAVEYRHLRDGTPASLVYPFYLE